MRRDVRQAVVTSVVALATVGIFVIAWKLFVVETRTPAYILPLPETVLATLAEHATDLVGEAVVTVREIVAGFLFSLVVGVATALAIHGSRRLHELLWPLILFLQITPQVALAPLLLTWLGIGLGLSIALITLIAFFPIVVNTYAGLQSMPPEMEELARSMRIGRLSFMRHFQLPHALPFIATGSRIGMTYAVVGAIIAEFLGSSSGLGYVVVTANGNLDAALMLAALTVLAAVGLALYAVVVGVERVVIPWHPSHRLRDTEIVTTAQLRAGM